MQDRMTIQEAKAICNKLWDVDNRRFNLPHDVTLIDLFIAMRVMGKELHKLSKMDLNTKFQYDDNDLFFEPIRIWSKEQTPSRIRDFLKEKGIENYKWTILISDDYQKDGICDEGYTNWLLKVAHGRYQMDGYIVAFLNHDPKLLFNAANRRKQRPQEFIYRPMRNSESPEPIELEETINAIRINDEKEFNV